MSGHLPLTHHFHKHNQTEYFAMTSKLHTDTVIM